MTTEATLPATRAAAPPTASATAPRPGGFGRWFRRRGWRHLVMIAGVAFALFPVLWIVSLSFNPSAGIQTQELLPAERSFDNFRQLNNDDQIPYWTWMWNTLVIGGVAALANTFLCALAAYAFSRMRFRGRRTGLLSILLVQMFPQILAMVAIFIMLGNLGDVFPAIGLGTRAGLILVYMGGALGVNTWLMKGFFDTIPRSLDESAVIDGATHNQIFFLIILPLAAPILAVVMLLGFIVAINEFVLASIILRDSSDFTLAVGLSNLVSDPNQAQWGVFAAGSLIAAVPVVLLWQFLQRYVVSGLTAGAVKE